MTAVSGEQDRRTGGDEPAEESAQPGNTSQAAAQRDILAEAEALIAALEAHSDPAVGHQLHALLQRIDYVHRDGLTRLIDAIQSMAGAAFINKLTADPAIRLLLMSYDLVAVERRLLAEEALDVVRDELRSRGVAVTITEVVGGAVYAEARGVEPGSPDEQELRLLVEEALRQGLIGFQQLELGRRVPATAPVQLGRRVARKPVYVRVALLDEIETESLHPVTLAGGTDLLLARTSEGIFAVQDACGASPLPLRFSRLEGHEVVCSWHSCRYDVRTGERLDHPGDRLRVFPARVSDGAVEVAIDTEPA